MGTKMTFNAKASMDVMPDIIELSFDLSNTSDNIRTAIKKLNTSRHQLKKKILSTASYLKDSYKQTSIQIRRYPTIEYYYEYNGYTVSEEGYKQLPSMEQMKYTKKSREISVEYVATLSIYTTLSYGDTTAKDLCFLYNYSVRQNISCRYNHTISNDKHYDAMKQLYIKCVNDTVKDLHETISKIPTFAGKEISIVSISEEDPYKRSSMCYETASLMKCESEVSREMIVIQELIDDTFNTPIEIRQNLEIVVEV